MNCVPASWHSRNQTPFDDSLFTQALAAAAIPAPELSTLAVLIAASGATSLRRRRG